MELYILRHAIAVERGTTGYANDFERPLTVEGEKKLRRIAKSFRQLDLSVELILSSPYVRARQTAEITADIVGLRGQVQLSDALGADSTPREFIAELRTLSPLPGGVLLVGHEPLLSGLISLLVSGTGQSRFTLKKAGLCKLSVNTLRIGRCATLEWLLTPRQMLLLS